VKAAKLTERDRGEKDETESVTARKKKREEVEKGQYCNPRRETNSTASKNRLHQATLGPSLGPDERDSGGEGPRFQRSLGPNRLATAVGVE